MTACTYNLSSGGGDRKIPDTCWQASPAQSMWLRFSETLSQKEKKIYRMVRKRPIVKLCTSHGSSVWKWAGGCGHTCFCGLRRVDQCTLSSDSYLGILSLGHSVPDFEGREILNSARTLPDLDCACMICLLHHTKRHPSSWRLLGNVTYTEKNDMEHVIRTKCKICFYCITWLGNAG